MFSQYAVVLVFNYAATTIKAFKLLYFSKVDCVLVGIHPLTYEQDYGKNLKAGQQADRKVYKLSGSGWTLQLELPKDYLRFHSSPLPRPAGSPG